MEIILGLLHPFPFEGNRNILEIIPELADIETCYTLSRLKGIETKQRFQ